MPQGWRSILEVAIAAFAPGKRQAAQTISVTTKWPRSFPGWLHGFLSDFRSVYHVPMVERVIEEPEKCIVEFGEPFVTYRASCYQELIYKLLIGMKDEVAILALRHKLC